VLIEDAIDQWPALKKWTADFWTRQYGNKEVQIDGKAYPLKEVMRLAQSPEGGKAPPYYRNIELARVFPELMADISPAPVYSQPNWFQSLALAPLRKWFANYGHYELFIGGAGRSFPYLHYDVPNAHTFLHQLSGHKLFILFPPSDSSYLYPKDGSEFNISRVSNLDQRDQPEFPLFAQTTRYEAMMAPGETMFMPCGWWHTARMPEFSISLGIDSANETNWNDIVDFLGKRARAKLGPLSVFFMAYLRSVGLGLRLASGVGRRH
jgi:hypothetical protein